MTSSRILHHVNFKRVKNLLAYLRAYEHWVYITEAERPTLRSSYDESIMANLTLRNDYLSLTRYASTDNDTDWNNLWPRVELVPRVLIPKKRMFHVRYEFSIVGDEEWRGIVFQLMDREKSSSGAVIPVFQLDIRNRELRARWAVLNKQYRNKGFDTEFVKSIRSFDGSQRLRMDLYGVLDPKIGLLILHINEREVWRRRNITATNSTSQVQIQYGAYGRAGTNLQTNVYELLWELVDFIPE